MTAEETIVQLFLVRHAQTESNLAGRIDTTAPGAGLTALGRTQADALAIEFDHTAVDAIFVSNLVRTQQTAAPLARRLNLVPVVDADIREIEAGGLDGSGGADAHELYVRTALDWTKGRHDIGMPGGENGFDFFGRFDRAIARIATQSASAVVVTHGASIHSWIAARATNAEAHDTNNRPIKNTGLVEVEGDPERGWVLRSWNGEPVAVCA